MIFHVDDWPCILELNRLVLGKLGYEVRVFENRLQALAALRTARPHPTLLITDYKGHEMDTEEFIHCCRQIQPDLRILMLSALVDPEIAVHSHAPPDLFLAKPYAVEELLESVAAPMGLEPLVLSVS